MMIKYNNTNVHALPYVTMKPVTLKSKRTGKKRTIMRVDENQSPSDIHWLRPGWNEFPKHIWEQNKAHPGIQKMIKTKMIEVMNEKVEVKKGKKKVLVTVGQDDEPIELKNFSVERAIEIVAGTLNRDILQRWIDEELRHKVKKALRKQIKPLLPEKKDEEDED